jgi:hypothetical protein
MRMVTIILVASSKKKYGRVKFVVVPAAEYGDDNGDDIW